MPAAIATSMTGPLPYHYKQQRECHQSVHHAGPAKLFQLGYSSVCRVPLAVHSGGSSYRLHLS